MKTAAELINSYGDLDRLLAEADGIKQPKRRENLINFADQARVSRDLVRLRDDAPMPLPLTDLKRCPRDMDRLKAFLVAQDFRRLLVRIGEAGEGEELRTAPAVGAMAPKPASDPTKPGVGITISSGGTSNHAADCLCGKPRRRS